MNEPTPHSLAERYVIGALTLNPGVLREVQREVVPHDFDDQRLGLIYAGIIRMTAEGLPVDYITVADHLPAWDVRGLGFTDLAAWEAEVPSAHSAAYYARMVREASVRRQLIGIGQRLAQSATGEPGVALASALESLREVRDRDVVGAETVKTLRQVLDVPADEDAYDWVIPDVLERRDRFMLTGSEGGGKSMLLRQLAVLAAAGLHPLRFTRIDPIEVLVVDAENSEKQWRRTSRAMADSATLRGARDPRDHLQLECVTGFDITRADDVGRVHRLIDSVRPDLLLIGPLYRLVPKGIKDDGDAYPVLAALDSLRDRGVAMLIEAHAGHATSSSGERDLRPRGSSALLGWPEFGLGLRRDREQVPGPRKFSLVRWRGDRDARDFPRKLTRHDTQIWPWEPTF